MEPPAPLADPLLSLFCIRRECGTAPGNVRRRSLPHPGSLDNAQREKKGETNSLGLPRARPLVANTIVTRGLINAVDTESALERSREVQPMGSLVLKGLINSGGIESRLERSRKFSELGSRRFHPRDHRPPSRQCEAPIHLNADGRLTKPAGGHMPSAELRWAQHALVRPASRQKFPALATNLDLPNEPLVGDVDPCPPEPELEVLSVNSPSRGASPLSMKERSTPAHLLLRRGSSLSRSPSPLRLERLGSVTATDKSVGAVSPCSENEEAARAGRGLELGPRSEAAADDGAPRAASRPAEEIPMSLRFGGLVGGEASTSPRLAMFRRTSRPTIDVHCDRISHATPISPSEWNPSHRVLGSIPKALNEELADVGKAAQGEREQSPGQPDRLPRRQVRRKPFPVRDKLAAESAPLQGERDGRETPRTPAHGSLDIRVETDSEHDDASNVDPASHAVRSAMHLRGSPSRGGTAAHEGIADAPRRPSAAHRLEWRRSGHSGRLRDDRLIGAEPATPSHSMRDGSANSRNASGGSTRSAGTRGGPRQNRASGTADPNASPSSTPTSCSSLCLVDEQPSSRPESARRQQRQGSARPAAEPWSATRQPRTTSPAPFESSLAPDFLALFAQDDTDFDNLL